MSEYRIVEEQYPDGGKRYVLERQATDGSQWYSVFAHRDLEEVRDAKKSREDRQSAKRVVIE